jgi:hypothetical protein
MEATSMPKTLRGPAAYGDIVPYLNQAMMSDGVRIEASTEAAAIKLVQRFNQFRILDRKINMKTKHERPLPEDEYWRYIELENRSRFMYLESPYDELIIRRSYTVVTIEKRDKNPWLKVTDLKGNPIQVEDPIKVFDPIKHLREEEHADRIKRHSTPPTPMPIRPVERENDIDPDQPLGLDISDEE